MIPGEYFISKGDIECNVDRKRTKVKVTNTGDRPIQVGSHCHFFEINRMMSFDRGEAFGMRLNIAAGTAVRFEPGEEKEVELVAFSGARRAFGINNLVNGDTTLEINKQHSLAKLKSENFKNK
ncbi:urease subunit beta [Flavobacterium johnsoniae]|uniref:Urease subunit beta n=1 Tax=Flavobacterium johnsoniae TaxID=986 RepID=A0A1J7CCW7_FLAJO|nr:urease subunit beta [Flavobacterium johnsoniae]OIV43665.1 urease subunit beta [Flavobacterium johnsoniae]